MGDFADDYIKQHPNILGLPQLQLDPSLAPPPGFMPSVPSLQLDQNLLPPPSLSAPGLFPDPTQPNPGVFGGGSPASSFNAFAHLADQPPGYGPPLLGPPVTGTAVNDPSSFTYNLGNGPVQPTFGADQTGTVSVGVGAGDSGPSMAATLNPHGVGQVQVGETVKGVGPFDLNLQGNVGTDGTVGGSAALQIDNRLRIGANGTYNPSSQSGTVGFGVAGTF